VEKGSGVLDKIRKLLQESWNWVRTHITGAVLRLTTGDLFHPVVCKGLSLTEQGAFGPVGPAVAPADGTEAPCVRHAGKASAPEEGPRLLHPCHVLL
jgi:hypothetical protein